MDNEKIPAYVMSLDDPGDLDAERGSVRWARAIRYQLQKLGQNSKTTVRDFQIFLKLLEETHGYQQLDTEDGHPFPSLAAFAATKIPYGLGYDPDIVLHLQQETRDMLLRHKVAEVQALREHGTNQHRKGGVDNVNSSSEQGGNSRTYLLARIKRDAPDVFARIEAGEFKSVHSAAKAAGIAHEPTPLDYLHRYWRKVPPDARLHFLREVLTPEERRALAAGVETEAAPGREEV